MMRDVLPGKRRLKTPGEIIVAEFLTPLGRTQQHLADALGTDRARVNAILKGRRAITLDLALRLEKVLGPSALFWMNLQQRYDLWKALRDPEVLESISRLEPLMLGFRKRYAMRGRLAWEEGGNPWHRGEDEA